MEAQTQFTSRQKTRRLSILGRWWAPGDIFIILAVVALCVFLIIHGVTGAGASTDLTVRVTANGKEVMSLPLQDGIEELTFEGYQGDSLLEISEGKVHMIDSACPDKLCVRTGWISRPGESIVCLPNKVVIEIVSGEGGPDAVNR
jgi:hypothetical protein